MLIELPLDILIKQFKLVSLGKLIGGLIHNLNGPLQNLGLDIEMASYSLNRTPNLDKKGVEDILARLKRMEDEFERINTIIKEVASRATSEDDNSNLVSLHDFFKQEILFLQSNLYFKHNVRTELKFEVDHPSSFKFPENFIIALGWLLMIFVEELEREKAKTLLIKTGRDNSYFMIEICTKKGGLSEKFIRLFDQGETKPDNVSADDEIGIMLIKTIFQSSSIPIKTYADSSQSNVLIMLPLKK